MTATYKKLKTGEWGIVVDGDAKAGDVVEVTTKAGKIKTETVARVLWSGDGKSICAVKQKPRASRRVGGYCGECGEPILTANQRCWETGMLCFSDGD
jgi:hypothetical protein